ncbi:MAG: sugar ABC transporter permease [Clostridiales bacterium]|nr:sugar ABC transporter permease [Clostridiales bacterium]
MRIWNLLYVGSCNHMMSIFSKKNRRRWLLTLLALPFVIHIIAIRYVPLAGWALAFFNYKPGKALNKLPFVGWKYFELIGFYKEDVINAVINTGVLSGLGILFSWFPMFLAILLNEIRGKYRKKIVQTLITIPNFVSWVIVYALCFVIFSTEGLFNQLFNTTNTLLTNKNTIWYFMQGVSMWKTAGWNSIIYLAAITGIDETLFEAAMVDGANRFQCILHITIPSLMSTFIVVLLLQIGSFMNTGYDQYYAFSNIMVQSKLEVLDLYTYRIGMKTMDYSFATAISILQSIVSVTLLMIVNGFSKLTRGEGII